MIDASYEDIISDGFEVKSAYKDGDDWHVMVLQKAELVAYAMFSETKMKENKCILPEDIVCFELP